MNLTKKLAATVFGVVAFAAVSQAQSTGVSATATATANIVRPISLLSQTNLEFGNIAVNTNSGTVKLDATTGDREETGGVTLPAITGTVSRATFKVDGESNYLFSITLPADGVVKLTHTVDASQKMPVDAFLADVDVTGTNLVSGTKEFNVGATLSVNSAQPAGEYSGTFTVSVNYN
jgi:hypothetical protein